jgi:uncharacterized membrane protein
MKIPSDETIKLLFGTTLAITLLIYKVYFADNSKNTAYEYWSSVIFSAVLLVVCVLYYLSLSMQTKKTSATITATGLILTVALIFLPIYNIFECVNFNRCFMYRTTHYTMPENSDYWISISIQIMLIIILMLIIIFFIRERLKKRNKEKLYNIAKQQRINKRIHDRVKKDCNEIVQRYDNR